MKQWVRMVAGEPAVLLVFDEHNVEARVGGDVDTFTKAEWESFPLYSGPVERAIQIEKPIDIRDPETWPYRPFLSVRNRMSGWPGTVVEPPSGQPRKVLQHEIAVVRAAEANGTLDECEGAAAIYMTTADLMTDYEIKR